MVKQRRIFEPERVDILTDREDKPQDIERGRLMIAANNEGLKFGTLKSQRKPHSTTPLFAPPENQAKLF